MSADARRSFEQAAQALFTGHRPSAEQSPVERAAFELALALSAAFSEANAPSLTAKLRAALGQLETQTASTTERRVAAVRAVQQWAPSFLAADERNRPWVLKQLVYALTLLDEAFADVNTDGLGEKLASYQRQDDSAARILAEIICEDCDALGLASDPTKSPHDDVEAVRQVLARAAELA